MWTKPLKSARFVERIDTAQQERIGLLITLEGYDNSTVVRVSLYRPATTLHDANSPQTRRFIDGLIAERLASLAAEREHTVVAATDTYVVLRYKFAYDDLAERWAEWEDK